VLLELVAVMSAVAPVDAEEDFGLFGPTSVTWRVHLEPVLWVGGIRALYLQALHPRVIRGTAQNSALFDHNRAWQRFQRTAEFVGIRTFGTTEEVARAGQRVRRLHARLRGYDPDTGQQFRIDDPQLLLWVHCSEIDSYVAVSRRAGVLTSTADADTYVSESRRAAHGCGRSSWRCLRWWRCLLPCCHPGRAGFMGHPACPPPTWPPP
jgi:uncharacterized protein (DUF2236 family)